MRTSLVSLNLIFILLILPLQSCGKSSFPQDKVIESVKRISKDEYHVDVQTKVVGKNLGTYIALENIFDREQGLSKEASENIGNLLLSVSRVSLSTDAPLDFYTVIASDKTIPGVEAVFTRNVTDVKRYLLGNISRDDFFQRLMIDVRFSPSTLAERTVLNFFSNMTTGNTRNLLANYLRKSTDSTEFSLAFLRMILEIKLKDSLHFEVLQLKIKPLASESALVYCKTKETYKPKAGYTSEDFTFPSGFIHEYLFLIGSSNYLPEIREIIPLDFKDENGGYKKKPFPAEYAAYQDEESWPKDDFLLDDITFPQFLAGQIAQRIVRKVRELEDDSTKKSTPTKNNATLNFKVDSVKGRYIKSEEKDIKGSLIQIDFKISQSSEDAIPSHLYDLSFEIIKDVIEKYHFKDFSEIRLSRVSSKDVRIIPKSAILK